MKPLFAKTAISAIMLFTLFMELLAYNKYFGDTEPPTKHTVKIFRMKFIPEHLTVKEGDTVEWINKDFYQHDVTDEKKNEWTSSPFGQNETWSKVITKDEQYFCNLHKTMKGTIDIK